jgi:hypothetical protein
LVDLACAALERGVDSPSLLELAGLPHGLVREAADLFRAALSELGIEPPDEDEALWHLVRWTARQIVAGAVSPIEGASWIWRKASYQVQEAGDLRVFVGLASEWDDHPEDRTRIEEQIVQEASELLGRPAPRQWIQLRAKHGRSLLTVQRRYGPAPMDAATLPLSESLCHGLARWAADYDSTADGFDSSSDAVAFVQRGRTLVARLQDELGDGWHVEYWPEPTQPPGLRLRRDARLRRRWRFRRSAR